ncbi:hypothetical protein [Wukongibacter sp. M2B1]|uniref:hypothetical protein n=1 Tax=Wukongibacter sp. M2B1 TaxID=3088895 RepID=UPI003D7A4F94
MEEVLKLIIGTKGINAYIVMVGILILKLSPVTLISSVGIERKLQSKEMNCIYKIGMCTLLSLASSVLISSILMFLMKTVITKFKIIYYLSIFIGFAMYAYISSKDANRNDDLINFKKRINKIFKKMHYFVSLYFGVWILIVIYTIMEVCNSEILKNQTLIYQYCFLLIISFILIFLTSIIAIYPLVNIVNKLNPINYYININQNKWYILYMIKNKEILLGEKYESSECEKYRILNRDELEKYDIFKERNEE